MEEKDFARKNKIASEITQLISEYDFPLIVLTDVNNRLKDCDNADYAEQQLRYLKTLVKVGRAKKKEKAE